MGPTAICWASVLNVTWREDSSSLSMLSLPAVHVLLPCSWFPPSLEGALYKTLTGISCETNQLSTWCSLPLTSLNLPVCFVVCSRAEQIPPCLTSESSLPSPWGTPALSRKRYWSQRSQSSFSKVFFFSCAYLCVNVVIVFCNFNIFLLFNWFFLDLKSY